MSEQKKEVNTDKAPDVAETKEFPSLRFTVDDTDTIDVSITICAIEDSEGNFRPRPVRRELLSDLRGTHSTRLQTIQEELAALPSDSYKRTDLTGESIALNSIIRDIDTILAVPHKVYTSKWKRITWRDLAQLHTDSYVDNSAGAPVWSEERFRDAKVRLLLKDWDLTEENHMHKQVKVPVSKAFQVDGTVVQAFIDEYDRLISLTNQKAKN